MSLQMENLKQQQTFYTRKTIKYNEINCNLLKKQKITIKRRFIVLNQLKIKLKTIKINK